MFVLVTVHNCPTTTITMQADQAFGANALYPWPVAPTATSTISNFPPFPVESVVVSNSDIGTRAAENFDWFPGSYQIFYAWCEDFRSVNCAFCLFDFEVIGTETGKLNGCGSLNLFCNPW